MRKMIEFFPAPKNSVVTQKTVEARKPVPQDAPAHAVVLADHPKEQAQPVKRLFSHYALS